MRRTFKQAGLCMLLALVSITTAWAQSQSTTGSVQGTVADEAGAVIAGAAVEVKNLDTNATRTLATDEGGRFAFLQLQPGRYTLTASKQGYATVEQQNLDVTVGQTVSLNLSLKVSAVQERITITAAPTIDTVKTESSSTLNELAV